MGWVIRVGVIQTFGMKKPLVRNFFFVILFIPMILLGCDQGSSPEIASHEADTETEGEKEVHDSINIFRKSTGQILKIASVSRINSLNLQVTED